LDTVQDIGHDILDISEAARRLGITPDAVRKRISRGGLEAHKRDGRWFVVLDIQDNESKTREETQPGHNYSEDDKDRIIAILQEELEARRREVQELHVLLQQAQAVLPSPRVNHRPWWWFWERYER
jgi:hypothetical protein